MYAENGEGGGLSPQKRGGRSRIGAKTAQTNVNHMKEGYRLFQAIVFAGFFSRVKAPNSMALAMDFG